MHYDIMICGINNLCGEAGFKEINTMSHNAGYATLIIIAAVFLFFWVLP